MRPEWIAMPLHCVVALACCLFQTARVCHSIEPDTSASVGDRLAEIERRHNMAREEYRKALASAASETEKHAAIDRFQFQIDSNANEALLLVREFPKDPAAIDALRFVIRTARGGPGNQSSQAFEILAQRHVKAPGLGLLCDEVSYLSMLEATETFLRGVLNDNPELEQRGLACFSLAQMTARQVEQLRKHSADPDSARAKFGEMKPFLKRFDVVQREAETVELYERTIKEFGSIKYDNSTLAIVASGRLFNLRNLAVGAVVPEIEGKDHEESPFRLSDYRGKVVLLMFTGDWCPPCREMYPRLRELVKRFARDEMAIVSVNTDAEVATLRRSIKDCEVTWRCWWDGDGGPIVTRWGIRSFPSVFVLDRQGKIRFRDVRGDSLERAIETLVAEPVNGSTKDK